MSSVRADRARKRSAEDRWAHLPKDVREEIDVFETQLNRVAAGQMSEKVFLETRLRHGVYGQRQSGVQMQRIKIPLGMLSAEQMICLANLSEEYADGISHITTRQDVQFHFISLEETPDIMRRLAEVGITTREACGNVVRNVTGCPDAGLCSSQGFDITPHALAMSHFLLRHPDAQNFGRKFKIAFSGCEDKPCGLAMIHDIGAIAAVKDVDGQRIEGFKVYLGGGLGAIPQQARLYSEFVPADEMLELAQAIARVFARFGEKKNRARARLKFLIGKLGIEEFRRIVDEERRKLPPDPRWESELVEAADYDEQPLRPPSALPEGPADPEFQRWLKTNVRGQKQDGYSMVEVLLPLGDIAADALRELARTCRSYIDDTIRTTVTQNLLLRWVSNGDLLSLHEDLKRLGLAEPGAARLADVTACPGTDSCKLGITSSRGLAAELKANFANGMGAIADREDIKVKISGCFNACGHHHIADIGFLGSVQRKKSETAPVFQVVLGGSTGNNGSSFGLVTGKVPARNAPEVVRKLTSVYTEESKDGESFSDFVHRLGKPRLKEELAELVELPLHDEAPEYYTDNRQSWKYRQETGVGECAGEMVDQAEFMLEEADRLTFEATLALDEGLWDAAAEQALKAVRTAADGLLSTRGLLLSDHYDTVAEFRERFYDTGTFYAPFAENFFRAAANNGHPVSDEESRRRVQEAALFVEMAQSVYSTA